MILRSTVQTLILFLVSITSVLENVVLATTETFAAGPSTECCSTCIGKPSAINYDYDPVIFDQCTKVTDGVCCFDCGTLGDPTYLETVSYGKDGVTAIAKTGTYIAFTWSGVVNVTYVALKSGQKKTVTPTVTDAAATMKKDTFLICARSPGTIYFRGWGKNACRQASTEHSITIEEGSSKGDTCDANDVKVPTAEDTGSSIAADETVANCNAQRASVQVVDGVRTCECVSDWTNPPECDRWPVWKWLVTICGGLATLFSIALSVRAFLQNRKKQVEKDNSQMKTMKHEGDYQENLAPMGTKSDLGSIDFTSDSRFHDGAAMTPLKETQFSPGGTRRPDERLFSL